MAQPTAAAQKVFDAAVIDFIQSDVDTVILTESYDAAVEKVAETFVNDLGVPAELVHALVETAKV